MNFFERQRQVRRVSARLVALFVLAVVGIVAVVDLAVFVVFDGVSRQPAALLGMLAVTSLATVAVIGLAALVRTVALRGGGGRVARDLGGVPVPPDTTDPQLRRLRNVVEEIAIASSVPVPEIYLLPREEGINAFAAGWSTSDAAIAVTRGTLERLNRDELQGVIAHEFSHVVNGDMRLNIRLMGLLFGILFLAVIGRGLLRTGFVSGGRSRSDNRGGNPLPLIGLAMVAAGYVGVLVGRLIKASVSRQREYLADASAVQFTRQTAGLAGALKKIAGLPAGSKLANPKSEEVGHMLFGSGARLSALFATHPPLPERIKALDPSFDPAELAALSQRWAAAPPSGLAEDQALGLTENRAPRATADGPTGNGDLPDADARVRVDPAEVLDRIGAAPPASYLHATDLLARIPSELLDQARRPDTVVPLILGLLLSADPQVRARQHAEIFERHGKALADATWQAGHATAGLHPLLRLPLAEVAFPALTRRPPAERDAVADAMATLVRADGRISVFEYCLSRLVGDELRESLTPSSRSGNGRGTLRGAPRAVGTLFSVLAQAGHPDPATAERAFAAGTAQTLPQSDVRFSAPANGVLELESAWPQLDGLRPAEKARLVAGAVAVISHDGVMTVPEIELLRTICLILHSPLPPLPVPA
ncbi:Zn-dependent protease with chaperone function [Micromonospora sp. Llam0]|uniref:M48 family metallopeptidase n=1 Tax=Micromonospora sp. Llam0 TaxID=2485143 RepID=UPI000F488925|nr:M48 family metallopeptidase [Micromonospora sp. Llam0]ROO61100.1 Zn-dependent protease with chaperone function [Micromonospora sp. Llam0]